MCPLTEAYVVMTNRLANPDLARRIIWGYALYLVLVLISFAVGYFFLPLGALVNTPWTAMGVMATTPESPLGQFITTIGFNLAFVTLLGVGLNLQRVKGLPTGYIFIFSAAIVSGLIAGTNSFASQTISPYTLRRLVDCFTYSTSRIVRLHGDRCFYNRGRS